MLLWQGCWSLSSGDGGGDFHVAWPEYRLGNVVFAWWEDLLGDVVVAHLEVHLG